MPDTSGEVLAGIEEDTTDFEGKDVVVGSQKEAGAGEKKEEDELGDDSVKSWRHEQEKLHLRTQRELSRKPRRHMSKADWNVVSLAKEIGEEVQGRLTERQSAQQNMLPMARPAKCALIRDGEDVSHPAQSCLPQSTPRRNCPSLSASCRKVTAQCRVAHQFEYNHVESRKFEADAMALHRAQKKTLASTLVASANKERQQFLQPIGLLLFGYYQVQGVLLALSYKSWPTESRNLASLLQSLLDTTGTDGGAGMVGLLSIFTCRTHADLCSTALMESLSVLVFLISMPLTYALITMPCRRKENPGCSRQLRFGHHNWKGQRLKDFVIKFELLAMVILQPIVANSLMRLYDCEVFGDISVMQSDVNVRCDESTDVCRLIGGAFIVLYLLGIPCLFLALLYVNASPAGVARLVRHWKDHNASNFLSAKQVTRMVAESIDRRYSVLYDKYHVRNWYWEVIETLRKLLLVSIVPIFGGNGATFEATRATQLLAAQIFLVSFMVAQAAVQPFRVEAFNWLMVSTQLASFATVTLALNGVHYGADDVGMLCLASTQLLCTDTALRLALLAQITPYLIAVAIVVWHYREFITTCARRVCTRARAAGRRTSGIHAASRGPLRLHLNVCQRLRVP